MSAHVAGKDDAASTALSAPQTAAPTLPSNKTRAMCLLRMNQ